jgi:transposase
MTTLTEGKHAGGFLVWEVLRDYTRETVTIASGAGKLAPGTVLGKITTGGKYTGLAPMARQSGQWRGKAFIQGGRKFLRDALYMPALVATRFNPDMKQKYNAMRKAGKPAKVALTAIMRKLIELANTLIKQDRKWAPNPA